MDENLIEQLRKWMHEVEEDVSDLVYFHDIFEQTNNKLKVSNLSEGNPLLNLFGYSYYSSAILAINRQVDHKPPVVSLMRIMTTVRDNIDQFTENWYKQQYGELLLPDGSNAMEGAGVNAWKENFSDMSFVERDIEELTNITANMRLLRDKRIAHKDENFVYEFDIKLEDVSNAVELVDKLTVRYSLLIDQIGWADNTMMPVEIGDEWQEETFFKPWLNK